MAVVEVPTRTRAWALACAVFVVAAVVQRLYWIAGGRWGYTACDRTDLVDPAGGCGADQVVALPFWSGGRGGSRRRRHDRLPGSGHP